MRPSNQPPLDDLLMAATLAEEARWRDARAPQDAAPEPEAEPSSPSLPGGTEDSADGSG